MRGIEKAMGSSWRILKNGALGFFLGGIAWAYANVLVTGIHFFYNPHSLRVTRGEPYTEEYLDGCWAFDFWSGLIFGIMLGGWLAVRAKATPDPAFPFFKFFLLLFLPSVVVAFLGDYLALAIGIWDIAIIAGIVTLIWGGIFVPELMKGKLISRGR